MLDIQLSKDNDLLICTLYKNFLEKVKNGSSKSEARWLGSSDEIQENLLEVFDETLFKRIERRTGVMQQNISRG